MTALVISHQTLNNSICSWFLISRSLQITRSTQSEMLLTITPAQGAQGCPGEPGPLGPMNPLHPLGPLDVDGGLWTLGVGRGTLDVGR